MKHGKKPTVAQRKVISAWSLNWENWLVVKDTPEGMVIVHRYSGKVREIRKDDTHDKR